MYYDVDYIKREGQKIIDKYSDSGIRWGIIPGVSSLALNPLIISMIQKINKMAGIDPSKDYADDLFAIIATNAIFTPLASIPLLGCSVMYGTIQANGEHYLNAVICAAEKANRTSKPITQLLKDVLKKGDYPRYKFQ